MPSAIIGLLFNEVSDLSYSIAIRTRSMPN